MYWRRSATSRILLPFFRCAYVKSALRLSNTDSAICFSLVSMTYTPQRTAFWTIEGYFVDQDPLCTILTSQGGIKIGSSSAGNNRGNRGCDPLGGFFADGANLQTGPHPPPKWRPRVPKLARPLGRSPPASGFLSGVI